MIVTAVEWLLDLFFFSVGTGAGPRVAARPRPRLVPVACAVAAGLLILAAVLLPDRAGRGHGVAAAIAGLVALALLVWAAWRSGRPR